METNLSKETLELLRFINRKKFQTASINEIRERYSIDITKRIDQLLESKLIEVASIDPNPRLMSDGQIIEQNNSYRATVLGMDLLREKRRSVRNDRIKFLIPVIISIAALIVSIISLSHSLQAI